MDDWKSFFGAEAAGAAALSGLLFVGLSLNLAKILSMPKLVDRARLAILLLLAVLVISSLQLVPDLTALASGIEILVAGLVVWTLASLLDARVYRGTDPAYRARHRLNQALTQAASLPYVVGGVVMLAVGPAGLYWVTASVVVSFCKAILDAWVLLVEINR